VFDPNYLPAINDRGVIYKERGDYDRAMADFNRILAIKPDDALALVNRATVYDFKGDPDRAMADFDRAVALEPNNPMFAKLRQASISRPHRPGSNAGKLRGAQSGDRKSRNIKPRNGQPGSSAKRTCRCKPGHLDHRHDPEPGRRRRSAAQVGARADGARRARQSGGRARQAAGAGPRPRRSSCAAWPIGRPTSSTSRSRTMTGW
jgi:tetratricopeptide (TPR) repeat protein